MIESHFIKIRDQQIESIATTSHVTCTYSKEQAIIPHLPWCNATNRNAIG